MKVFNLKFPVCILLAMGASLSNAAYLDLQTGIAYASGGAQLYVTSTSAQFTTPAFPVIFPGDPDPVALLYFGNVTELTSFEYSLSDSGFGPRIYTSGGELEELTPTLSGFKTYNFSTPYSGSLNINYVTFLPGPAGMFTIRNLALGSAVSPVPEPETYAMLLAGMGVMGAIARRRRSSARPA